MQSLTAKTVLLIFTLMSTVSHAGTYECEVVDALTVNREGKFERYSTIPNSMHPIGTRFTVDSTSGVVIGSYINNQRGNAREPVLIGKAEGKFHHLKIFTVIPEMGADFPMLLEIRDQLRYPDKNKIPFSAYFLSEVLSGHCRRNH